MQYAHAKVPSSLKSVFPKLTTVGASRPNASKSSSNPGGLLCTPLVPEDGGMQIPADAEMELPTFWTLIINRLRGDYTFVPWVYLKLEGNKLPRHDGQKRHQREQMD